VFKAREFLDIEAQWSVMKYTCRQSQTKIGEFGRMAGLLNEDLELFGIEVRA
jgi:hypothetical protein